MEQSLDRELYLKIKTLYEDNPRRFRGWRGSTHLGTKFSLTDKMTGEVFKGWHSVGYYAYRGQTAVRWNLSKSGTALSSAHQRK